jgi:hypothetical protein
VVPICTIIGLFGLHWTSFAAAWVIVARVTTTPRLYSVSISNWFVFGGANIPLRVREQTGLEVTRHKCAWEGIHEGLVARQKILNEAFYTSTYYHTRVRHLILVFLT